MAQENLNGGGHAVQDWLDANGHSQQWLVHEMNRMREAHGSQKKLGRASLWRWMTAKILISIDDAKLIKMITGTELDLWSQYSEPAPAGASRKRSRKPRAA